MRALVAALMVAAVMIPPCRLRAAPVAGAPTKHLVVGRPIAFTPPTLPVSVICDDTSVVAVEDAGTSLRITGLKAGATACSFGSALQAGRRQIYNFEVRAAP
jgi:hypothetical protein